MENYHDQDFEKDFMKLITLRNRTKVQNMILPVAKVYDYILQEFHETGRNVKHSYFI